MKLIIESYICLFWILALSDLDTLTYNHISLCDLVLLYYKRITLIQLNLPLKIKRLATLKKKEKKKDFLPGHTGLQAGGISEVLSIT